MYKLVKAEQETIIRWDAEERIAHIDTAYAPMIAKLDRLVEAHQIPTSASLWINSIRKEVRGASLIHQSGNRPARHRKQRHGRA
jgi:hypothetical protein